MLSFKKELNLSNGKKYHYYSLDAVQNELNIDISALPISLKILLENLVRHYDNKNVTIDDLKTVIEQKNKTIYYYPSRVLMQDFTGVPALVDLAVMRDAAKKLGIDPTKINPLIPVDLIIDHSVQVDKFNDKGAFEYNVNLEVKRNFERYKFLKWGQKSFANFRVVPPGMGICHQVNLEYLAQVVWTQQKNGESIAYPDTLVGTDSHTTMINGLSVLGWGVGGIEAESVMLGQPIQMLNPEVYGVKLIGQLQEGVTATDLVLNVTHVLRKIGVVGKFVEFYGEGLKSLSLSDRATISNMAPEYGATCGFFPIDQKTIEYLRLTGRDNIELVIEYAKVQGLWHNESIEPKFTKVIEIDLNNITSSLAGPKHPQDQLSLSSLKASFTQAFPSAKLGDNNSLQDGSIVIAAITSCTNTSNPYVMIAAGIVARNALKRGIKAKPWVKTSLAPGSKVVTEYLIQSGLQESLDEMGFSLVGYGCTTCIGNSGPLPPEISLQVQEKDLTVASILSGNRNFEGRIHPQVKANYLASPPLVVAYSLVGSINIDLSHDPIGKDNNGNEVFLRDIWPSSNEITSVMNKIITKDMFIEKYQSIFEGDENWQQLGCANDILYPWDAESTYVQQPPYFDKLSHNTESIDKGRIIALLGDSTTTDHISPAGAISIASPAGKYLQNLGVLPQDFNSYGSRRGNHNVMMRGTFANIRIKNEMLNNIEGGFTKYIPSDEVMSIYDAAMLYQKDNTPLVVIAGKEYGTGSSRDWAAKGTALLGIRAVIAESFERIHRSNLIGMGVLPLMLQHGINRKTLKLDGSEVISINLDNIYPSCTVDCEISKKNIVQKVRLLCRIDTEDELQYFTHGGIMQYVLLKL